MAYFSSDSEDDTVDVDDSDEDLDWEDENPEKHIRDSEPFDQRLAK